MKFSFMLVTQSTFQTWLFLIAISFSSWPTYEFLAYQWVQIIENEVLYCSFGLTGELTFFFFFFLNLDIFYS